MQWLNFTIFDLCVALRGRGVWGGVGIWVGGGGGGIAFTGKKLMGYFFGIQ
jgi:hypothetical protein